MDEEKVLKIIKETNIEFVWFQCTDVRDKLYTVWIPSSEIESTVERGASASGTPYFTGNDMSDILLKPDLSTFRVLPWTINGRNVAAVMCDVCHPDGGEFEDAPRTILKRAIRKLEQELGNDVVAYAGPECEFFLVTRTEDGGVRPHDNSSYLSSTPSDPTLALELREEICHALNQMDIKVIKQHHEAVRAKHEIDIAHDKMFPMADKMQWRRMVIRKLANDRGLIATFMPKPFSMPGGAGWHTHMSIVDEKKGTNLFYAGDSKYGISDLGMHFIGGVLKHARALAAISNSTVNSYKRLLGGRQNGRYIAWGRYNRSTLIRIPEATPKATRIEYRASDGLCNYYLFFAALLYAGLDGIAKRESPPPPYDGDVLALTEEGRIKHQIGNMPTSLGEALEELKRDEVVKDALGSIVSKYLRVKTEEEWIPFCQATHEWERTRYLEEHFTSNPEFSYTGGKAII